MERKRIDGVLLKMLYLAVSGIVVTQVLGLTTLTSALFTLTFPLTVLLWLWTVRQTLTKTDLLMLLTAAMAAAAVLLNALTTRAGLAPSALRKLVMFIMTLLFLQTASRLRPDGSVECFADAMADGLTVFLLAAYALLRPQMYRMNGVETEYLTLGFTNPNLAGMFLVSLYMLRLRRLCRQGSWYSRLLHLLLAGGLAYLVLRTQSRNCLLALSLYTLLLIGLGGRKLRVGAAAAHLIAWAPALFAAVYLPAVGNPWIQWLFSFLTGEGKLLDSRTEIWTAAVEAIGASPLIGNYHGLPAITGESHLHNSHLEIAGSYGLPVLMGVCLLLARYLRRKGSACDDRAQTAALLGFVCTVVMGLGEAALFSGGLGIYILAGTFLMLSNGTRKEETDESDGK